MDNFEELEIHTLICNRDVLLAINNFKSLQKFDEFKNVPVYLHDDGSLTKSDISLLDNIKNVILIDRKEADKEIEQHIKDYPNCMSYRLGKNPINLWHKIKTFDYYYFSKSKKILGLDTDLLFMKKPENIINLINSNTPFYFPDVQSSYCFNEPKDEIPVFKSVNTGLIYIPSPDYYNIESLEFALTNLVGKGVNYFPSWIEQSAFAHMFYKDGHKIPLEVKMLKYEGFLNVEFYWGLEKTGQQFLDHIFKIIIDGEETEYKFQSNKNGFFIINLTNQNFDMYHTYDWYNNMKWEKLDTVKIEKTSN